MLRRCLWLRTPSPSMDVHRALRCLGLTLSEARESSTLRARYHSLAKVVHPDTPGGDSRRMQEIVEAYKVLHGLKTEKEEHVDTFYKRGVLHNRGLSDDARVVIVILGLVFFFFWGFYAPETSEEIKP